MEKNIQNTFLLAVGVCCCLKICNSDVNMVVRGLVLGHSLMILSTVQTYILFILYYEVCCCLHVK